MHDLFLLTKRALKLGQLLIQSAMFLTLFLGYRDLLKIKLMKMLVNLDRLTYYCCCAYFVSINSLSARVRLTFDSIRTVPKSSSRIL